MWMMAVLCRLSLSGLIFLLNCLHISYGSEVLSFKMQMLPAVFGQHFTMWCEIKNSTKGCNDIRQWYGGRHFLLLCEDGTCLKVNKYTESILQDCSYKLIISNLSENDLNCYYGCQYGFNQVRKELTLDESKFRYFPTNNDIDLKLTTTEEKLVKLELNVKKVFPKPTCHINLTETDQIMVLQEVKKQGTFDQMSLNATIPQRLLLGCNVMVVCEIGERNVTIVDKKLVEYNSKDSEDGVTGIVVAVGVVILVVVTCVILSYIFLCRKADPLIPVVAEGAVINSIDTGKGLAVRTERLKLGIGIQNVDSSITEKECDDNNSKSYPNAADNFKDEIEPLLVNVTTRCKMDTSGTVDVETLSLNGNCRNMQTISETTLIEKVEPSDINDIKPA